MKQKRWLSLFLVLAMMVAMVPAVLADDTAADAVYVLMNIPYAEFYQAELGEGGVDAITSATLNGKARNVNVNGASYHQSEEAVSTEGIAGVTYPVKASLSDLTALGGSEIKDTDKIEYELTARGQTSTVTLEGKATLQEAPSYSYYVLEEAPAAYKELTVSAGKAAFGKAEGTAKTGAVTGEVTAPGRHADIEIALSGLEVTPAEVSGVIVSTGEGSYALHHVVNIWRGTEIGWNLSDMDLGGQTVNNVRYYFKDGSFADYSTAIEIPRAGYVLMNIPYADFYKAEVGDTAAPVDAVSSATKNKPRTGGLAGGSYHVDPEGTDISGVIYPVFVSDTTRLDPALEVTDEASVSITVTNRGQQSTTEYVGKDALFEAPSYSYYILSEKPRLSKALTIDAEGAFSFGPISARAQQITVEEPAIEYHSHHNNFIEINLGSAVNEALGENVNVSGAIATVDGVEMPLTHIENLWRVSSIGWPDADAVAGKTITNVRFITRNGVYDCPVNIPVKLDSDAITAAFEGLSTINVTGLPEDIENPVATVQSQVGRGETPVVIAENVAVTDGKITTTEPAAAGAAYTVTVVSDNYADLSATAEVSEGEGFLSRLIGDYQPLLEGATLNSEYDHYWHDYTAAVVGASAADETVAYVKASINAGGYGDENEAPNFFCGFTGDVATITFGGEDGKTVTFTKSDGSSVTHTYAFLKEAEATGTFGEYDMAMPGYLYQAREETEDEFRYLLMFPDTPDTTFHLEFRYAGTEEDVLNLLDGPYAYWVGSAISCDAMTEEDEDTLQKVISLFVVENLAEMQNEETAAQRTELVGTWDCDFSAFPEYGNAQMYIVLSEDGTGKTYADLSGTGELNLVSEYTFFAYDSDPADGKSAGTYIAMNPDAETVTPGAYEITEIQGKKALVFTSNEGVITYYLRAQEPGQFQDVAEDAWYYDAVYHCLEQGYFKGESETMFVPGGTMTRAMFATVLYRIAGEPEPAGENPFSDVESGKWYTDAVIWAAGENIIKGYGNGRFGTDDPVTREQMAAIFWRYLGQPQAENTDLTAFSDADQISGWARDAFAWAVSSGIINGKGSGILDPKGEATRAEVAQIVMNYDTKIRE